MGNEFAKEKRVLFEKDIIEKTKDKGAIETLCEICGITILSKYGKSICIDCED